MVKLTPSTAGGPMKVLVRLRASSIDSRHRSQVAGSPVATREVLRWNEPNLGEGLAAEHVPRESEPNLQNEANLTLNVNKMKSLMRETPRRFYASIRAGRFPGD